MPTILPIRASQIYERPTRALAALILGALALLVLKLPTEAAHRDIDPAFIEVLS